MILPITLKPTGNGTMRLTISTLTAPVTEWRKVENTGQGLLHLPTDHAQWPDWLRAIAPLMVRA